MRIAILCAAATLALSCNKAASPAAGTLAAQGATQAPDTVVATYVGGKVTLGELDGAIAKKLYDLRHGELEKMIVERLVKEAAKKAGKANEEELLKEIAKGDEPASEEELKFLFEANREMFGDTTFDEVKGRLSQSPPQQIRVAGYVERLKLAAKIDIALAEPVEPRVEVAAVGPSKGPDKASVTIVEFSDFQCPFCSKARKTADRILADFSGKVRLVFRDFPLPFHDKAVKAAEAGACAGEQGKFWEMHDWMFDHQDKLGVDELKEGATSAGVDAAKFAACLDGGKFAGKVKDDVEAGKKAGVSGTPAFFINGLSLSGAQPYAAFKKAVEQELKGK